MIAYRGKMTTHSKYQEYIPVFVVIFSPWKFQGDNSIKVVKKSSKHRYIYLL